MKRAARGLLLAAAFLGAAAAFAQDATLVAIKGQVSIQPFEEKRHLKADAGNALIFGDGIRTGPNSIAHLELAGGKTILVRENTSLTINGSPQHARVDFEIGEFLIGLKEKLAANETFEVATPAAVASVRGTLFWGKTDAHKLTTIAGLGNTVAVKARGKSVTLKAGQSVTVFFGEPPHGPIPASIARSYLKNFAVGDVLEGVEALIDKSIK